MKHLFQPTRPEVVIDCDCSRRAGHGSPHTYSYHGCGCTPCRSAMNRDIAERRTKPRTVDAAEVRDRILLLRDLGVSTKQLSADLGYHYNTLYIIVSGTSRRTSRFLAEDVFSYPLPLQKDTAS